MDDDGSLTDEEFGLLAHLLRRFADNDMDQFDNWRLSACNGDVFISVTRQPAPGAGGDAHSDITSWLSDDRDPRGAKALCGRNRHRAPAG